MVIAAFGRFELTGHSADLDEAITVGRDAVAATPADHLNRPMYLSNLSLALRVRFESIGQLTDLEEAITVGGEAVAATCTVPKLNARVMTWGFTHSTRTWHDREPCCSDCCI
jgi:hypothetical protein